MRNEPNSTLSSEGAGRTQSPPPISAAEGVRLALAGYRLLVGHARDFLRLAAPWVLLACLPGTFRWNWSEPVFELVGWLAWAAVFVAWSRLILRGAACPIGGNLGRRERRHLLVALPMLAAGFLAMIVAYVGVERAAILGHARLEARATSPWFLWVVGEAGLLAYLLSSARFQLMFPVIAIDDRAVTFRSSLRLTRGSTAAIFVGSVIACAPSSLPSLADWFPEDMPGGLAHAAAHGLDRLASLAAAAVLSGFCAQLYARQFGAVTKVFE